MRQAPDGGGTPIKIKIKMMIETKLMMMILKMETKLALGNAKP